MKLDQCFPSFVLILLLSLQCWCDGAFASLAEFVNTPDPSYSYEVIKTWTSKDVDYVNLRLTSQIFQGTSWQHILTLARPLQTKSATEAILIIGGGRHDQLPSADNPNGQANSVTLDALHELAVSSGLICASVEQIPYQPIFGGKMEDEIVAHTLTQFFQSKDDRWPLLLPMTKATIRAMDTIQKYAKENWHLSISGFTLSGESKRGWTSWLTAAADERVNGLVPMVFNMLNMSAQLDHQLETWGKYSEELGDYASQGLPQMLKTDQGRHLLELIDPFSYRSRLTATKLILLGTNDQYWPLDAASLYFSSLPEPKYLLYVPNSGHDTKERNLVNQARLAVALAAAGNLKLPIIQSQITAANNTDPGSLIFDSQPAPRRLILWQTTSQSKDFRNAKWQSKLVSEMPKAGNKTIVKLDPKTGFFSAAFLSAEYLVSGKNFTLSSEVAIIPPKPL
jgi:PhoPQ-activated pathogenicity-related protein